jgi:hypothetical protein
MTKKEQIEEIYIDALNNDEAPNVFADRILFLFGLSKRFKVDPSKVIKSSPIMIREDFRDTK